MKVLHVSTSDIKGGAAKAAYRIHRALLSQEINSQMIVALKSTRDKTVIVPKHKLWRHIFILKRKIDKIPTLFYRKKGKGLFSPSSVPSLGIIKKINDLRPDIVHLHWIQSGMIRVEDIKKIKAPIIWSCHDMWPFTSGYHYDYFYDFDYKGILTSEGYLHKVCFKRKRRTYFKKDIVFVGLSNWMHQCIKNSELLQKYSSFQIPNPIDTTVFCPMDNLSKQNLKIEQKDKNILFGAIKATDDPRKGGRELIEALKKLNDIKFCINIFGSTGINEEVPLSFDINYLGHINDENDLVKVYNSADVMVVPSLQENLVQTAIEALACGIPVVAFKVGGLRDIVDHKVNGYLAKPFDTDDLAIGIRWILNHTHPEQLAENARTKVLKVFDQKIVAKQYVNLYRFTLSGNLDLSS